MISFGVCGCGLFGLPWLSVWLSMVGFVTDDLEPVAKEEFLLPKIDKLIRGSDDRPQGGGHLKCDQNENEHPHVDVASPASTHAAGGLGNDTQAKNKTNEPHPEAEDAEKHQGVA